MKVAGKAARVGALVFPACVALAAPAALSTLASCAGAPSNAKEPPPMKSPEEPARSPSPSPPPPIASDRGDAIGRGPEAASPEGRAALREAPTVYVKWRARHRWEDLEVEVVSLEVKLDSDGREVLRAGLDVRAGDLRDSLSFSGDDQVVAFAGYLVQVRGGSKEAVGLAVIRAPARR